MKLKISTDGRLTIPQGTTIELDGKPLLCSAVNIKIDRLNYVVFELTTIGILDGRKVTGKMELGMVPGHTMQERGLTPGFHIDCDVMYLQPEEDKSERLERKVRELEAQVKELKARSK